MQEALECFDKALEVNPRNACVGIYLKNLGRNQEALECFGKALEINTLDFCAYDNKCNVMKS